MNKKSIFSILLCISIFITSIMINPIAVAGDTTAANNWSTSDVRKFLNGADDNDKGDYANYFTDVEYGVILSKAINGSTSTDRFYLPGHGGNHVISWKTEEITNAEANISYIIPKAYWAENDGGVNWLRSAATIGDGNNNAHTYAHTYKRGASASNASVSTDNGVAPLFHINMDSVIFASCVSAANLLQSGDPAIAQMFQFVGSDGFGRLTVDGEVATTPEYGMYLKTKDSNEEFQVSSVGYSNRELTIQYKGANIGKAIVVHMYSQDDLSAGCYSYVAASEINNSSGTCTINCSNWGTPSLDNLVMQIWMEDPKTGVSMAQATEPQSFSFINGKFTETTPTIKNLRVFALTEELSCSWGDYTTEYYPGGNQIIKGENNESDFSLDGTERHNIGGTQMGPYATNQKIYFGTDSNGNPLAHWIAGREAATGAMCLYQTKAVNQRAFYGGTLSEQQGLTIQITDVVTSTALATVSLNCKDIDSTPIKVSVSGGDSSGTITYRSSNPYVASVDENGVVAINNPGTFEILATKSASGNYSATIRSEKIVVEDHTYREFHDENDIHFKKCTQESCNSIVERHPSNYVAKVDVHKCDYYNCDISHEQDWEKMDNTAHRCKQCNMTENHAGGTATCDKVAVCSACNSEYGTVDTNNHEYDDTTWKYDTTHHWHACAKHEEAVSDKEPHTWSEWTTQERTRAAGESIKTRSCTVCDAVETETIQNLPTTPGDDTEQTPGGNTPGDNIEQTPGGNTPGDNIEQNPGGNTPGDNIEQNPGGNSTGNQTINGGASTGVLPNGTGQSPENGQTGNAGTATDITVVSPKTGIEESFMYIVSACIVVSGAVMLYKKRNILKK